MIGIYKYQNKLNNKIYIGRSTNITKRKWEHLHSPSPYSYFDSVLQQIGEEAFDFEVVEECTAEQLRDKEKYWIAYYNCCVLDNQNGGYNLTRGGEEYRSEENPWSKLTISQVEEIIDKLANTTISMEELSKKYKVHRNTISDINRGKTWSWLHDYKGNIREQTQGSVHRGELNTTSKITEEEAQYIINLLENDSRSIARISKEENISSNILYDINRCRTWKHLHNYKKNIRKEHNLTKE